MMARRPLLISRVVCVGPSMEVTDLLLVGYADMQKGQTVYEDVSLAGVVGLPAYREYPMLRVFGERDYAFRCRVPIGSRN